MINFNINKRYQHATELIQRLINITHLLSIGIIVAQTFCLRKCVCLLFLKFVWNGKQFLAKQKRGIEINIGKFGWAIV